MTCSVDPEGCAMDPTDAMDPQDLQEVRKIIEKSTSKVSLRDLEKKGFRKVKVNAVVMKGINDDLATMRKQAQPMLTALENVFHGHPFVPSLSA